MFQNQYNPYSSQYQIDQLNNRIRQNNGYSNSPMYAANSMPPIVYGRASAESAMTPPNSRVLLMDGDLPRVYMKETDATGAYKLTAYDLLEVKEEMPQATEYVTRQEFEEWKKGFMNEPVTSSATDDGTGTATAATAAVTVTPPAIPDSKPKSIEQLQFSNF